MCQENYQKQFKCTYFGLKKVYQTRILLCSSVLSSLVLTCLMSLWQVSDFTSISFDKPFAFIDLHFGEGFFKRYGK